MERVVNQMLQEMDSIKRSKDAPFVLLASNCPERFDFAVYRRVPSRVYMGLPTYELRLKLLRILLRDEVLDKSVDIEHLAHLSSGFSGSDLKNLCVGAAQACEGYVNPRDRRRLIKWTHFEIVLKNAASTVSTTTLAQLRAFAAEYDPPALKRIKDDLNTVTVIAAAHGSRKSQTSVPARNHDFHRVDMEADRPNLKNIDTGSMPMRRESIERVKFRGGDDSPPRPSIATPILRPDRTPVMYSPLGEGNKRIRVLSILPGSSGSLHDDSDMPYCEMITVELDDWTGTYRTFLKWMKEAKLPSTPKYRHAMWAFNGAYTYASSQSQQAGEGAGNINVQDALDWTESRMSDNNDWRLRVEDGIAIPHRFNWGDFVALSYVWGDEGRRRDISVNGHIVSVTANLYDALINLRESEEITKRSLHLWIDALCINQADLHERAREVKKMDTIYSECLAVRGWLGKPHGAAGRAIVSQLRYFLDATVQVDPKRCTWEMAENFIEPDALIEGAHMLLTVPFWERLWIVQEIAVAPAMHFKFGSEQFMSRDLLRLAGWCVGLPRPGKGSPDLSRAGLRLHRLRRWTEGTEVTSNLQGRLVETLRLAQSSLASDPRDKVYGLLALLPKEMQLQIEPEYSIACIAVDVFRSFSIKCYKALGNLDLLARSASGRTRANLPTWAMDLERVLTSAEPRGVLMDGHRHRKYHANGRLQHHGFSFTNDERHLTSQGALLDTILSIANGQNTDKARCYGTQSGVKDDAMGGMAQGLSRLLRNDEHSTESAILPSVSNIPWLTAKDLATYVERSSTSWTSPADADLLSSSRPMPWPELYHKTGFAMIMSTKFHPNENFAVGNRSLRSYFARYDKGTECRDTGAYRAFLWSMHTMLSQSYIVTTSHGRLALVPESTLLGNKIAVLCDCDKPMALRSVGNVYEIVGSCFVDGLMRGEAADQVESPEENCKIEELTLC